MLRGLPTRKPVETLKVLQELGQGLKLTDKNRISRVVGSATLVKNLTLAVLTALLCFVAAEVGTRISLGGPWPERLPLLRVRADEHLGWVMLPRDFHYTYDIPVRLNSLGFRSPEIEIEKADDNEFRILAIGDSHIYGQGVADSELATARMETSLKSAGLQAVRVVNLGVRAYSLRQYSAVLETVGSLLDPDYILLFFYINDFKDEDVDRAYREKKDLDWYTFDLSGKPTGDRLRRWKWLQLFRKSAFVMWGHDALRLWSHKDSLESQILSGRHDSKVDRSLRAAESYFEEVRGTVAAIGVPCSVVIIPVSAQIASPSGPIRYQDLVRRMAREAGLDSFDLLEAFQSDYALSGRVPVIPYDGHYDGHGQSVMGTAVADHLLPRIGGLRMEGN